MVTVLFIEDNQEIRENTVEMLELAGYRVLAAANGEVGLALAFSKIPDIILCDIMMPGINGFEVLNRLKENEVTSDIPFIFVTASVEKKNVQSGMELDAAGYIAKPFELTELLNAIETGIRVNYPASSSGAS